MAKIVVVNDYNRLKELSIGTHPLKLIARLLRELELSRTSGVIGNDVIFDLEMILEYYKYKLEREHGEIFTIPAGI